MDVPKEKYVKKERRVRESCNYGHKESTYDESNMTSPWERYEDLDKV